jgi:hypothetical protein
MALTDLNIVELGIISRFLDRVDTLVAENPDTRVWVHDSEEWSYRHTGRGTYRRAEAEDVVGITDATVFRIWVGDDYSEIHFYHGNGEDVLSDMVDSKNGAWIGARLTEGLCE